MNERIKELVKKAGGHFSTHTLMSNPVQHRESIELWDNNIEKFAELIVEECGEIAYKAYWDNPETVRGIHIKEKIKKHFGVEE
jgi:hypothetical protein